MVFQKSFVKAQFIKGDVLYLRKVILEKINCIIFFWRHCQISYYRSIINAIFYDAGKGRTQSRMGEIMEGGVKFSGLKKMRTQTWGSYNLSLKTFERIFSFANLPAGFCIPAPGCTTSHIVKCFIWLVNCYYPLSYHFFNDYITLSFTFPVLYDLQNYLAFKRYY